VRTHSDLSPGLDTSELEGTSLSKRKKYHLKKTAEIRSTMQFLNRPGQILVEYKIFNQLREMGFDLVPERDNKSGYDPNKIVSQLARYGKKPDLSRVDRTRLQQAMAVTLSTFGGKHDLKPNALSEDLWSYVKGEKSAGLPSLSKKSRVFEADLFRAGRISRGERAPDPCVAYHRVQHGDTGPKTRLVWGFPQSMFLLEARFAPLLIEHFLERTSPMAFGLLKSQVSARMQQIRNSGLRYSLDFSGFDSSISSELIDFAFGVLKTHFHFSSREEEYVWDKIVNYFIHTPILLPNEEVWVKHHGVPSGSYFTQMVDSVVNFLAVTYAWICATGQSVPAGRVLVLGDDSLIGQSKYVPLSVISQHMNELGLKLNTEKTGLSRYGGSDVHFLGHFWSGGFADRPLIEVAKRMAFPETPSGIKDATDRYCIRSLSYVSDAVSAHKLVCDMSPARHAPWVEQIYMAYHDKMGYSGDIPSKLRPGMQSHLEDVGILGAVTSMNLAYRQPMLGPWM